MGCDYEIEYAMQALFIAKPFYDHGCLDRLLQAAGGTITLSGDELGTLELAAAVCVFADTRCFYQEGRLDRRLRYNRSSYEGYVLRDPLLDRYDRLCRAYEAAQGCTMAEDPFARALEREVHTCMQMNSYCYEYYWKPGDGGRREAKLVLLLDEEFCAYYSIPPALFGILDFCEDGIPELEAALREAFPGAAHLPPVPAVCRKEAA